MMDKLQILQSLLEGELAFDKISRNIYATDASVYQQIPQAVCWPKSEDDLLQILNACHANQWNITLRAAGTSLAGQAIGDGIIVDMSRYFTQIIDFNEKNQRIIVQPGVIRDELNQFLIDYNLFFGPNTSTSNRCNIGGMVGNNSSGTTSIKYGTTRDHVYRLKAILSDGSKVEFKSLSQAEFKEKCLLNSLEGDIYRHINKTCGSDKNQDLIRSEYPKPQIGRRNTGYALDELLEMIPFENNNGSLFNFCKLICGSEGTLAIVTEIELNLSALPPRNGALICVHFKDLKSTMEAVPRIMTFHPDALEMMDKTILDCTIGHKTYEKYRGFVEGDPFAILMIEIRNEDKTVINTTIDNCISHLKEHNLGYSFPILYDDEIDNAWKLRKAGLGLLANLPGDKKAVACIEDTAVAIEDLKYFILEFDNQMRSYNQDPVYYAHAGAGELHIRPILDLKNANDVKDFRSITQATAKLVKKYNGSMSGEHGDGRVRAEFIPIILGDKVYEILKDLKATWDPNNILNPGKIVNSPPMDEDFRVNQTSKNDAIETLYDFSNEMGILRAVEKCNGSGDCRKTSKSGGVMCPSYMATMDEKMTTRARANMMRIVLNSSKSKNSPFADKALKSILDQCLSCKGCLSECPSNVDMTALKAEANYQYYKGLSRPFHEYIFGNANLLFKYSSRFSRISNFINSNRLTSHFTKRLLNIHPKRKLPKLAHKSFKISDEIFPSRSNQNPNSIFLFADEFTRFHDPMLINKAIKLLNHFGYNVKIAPIEDSARSQLSKGLLSHAKKVIQKNITILDNLIKEETPLIGIEPSTILGFRDEYPKILNNEYREKALSISKHCFTIDEFLLKELKAGNINLKLNDLKEKHIKIHTHCHQKALCEDDIIEQLLSYFSPIHVDKIPSGCCGMAGSFGYDKNNYKLSMDIGELILFPSVRTASENTQICANGTSCRHQIEEGTGKKAQHIVDILYGLLFHTEKLS